MIPTVLEQDSAAVQEKAECKYEPKEKPCEAASPTVPIAVTITAVRCPPAVSSRVDSWRLFWKYRKVYDM